MKFTTRQLCLIAVFAAACSAVETTVGTMLKTLSVPFSSAILVGINIVFYLVLHKTAKHRWAILSMSVVIAGSMLLYAGPMKMFSALAILVQGAILQTFFYGGYSRLRLFAAIVLIELYKIFHPFIRGVLLGRGGLELMLRAAERGIDALGFEASGMAMLLLIFYSFRLLTALPFAMLAYSSAETISLTLFYERTLHQQAEPEESSRDHPDPFHS